MMYRPLLLLFILVLVMAWSLWFKKLTVAGAICGSLIGLCVYAGAGFTGIALLGAFFILGTVATSFKKEEKETSGLTVKIEAQRTAGQVLANGGTAGLLGIAAAFSPQHALVFQVMLAASLSSAAADTLSSELGLVLGKRFYNIRTLQKDSRGLDGVISLEGTLAGLFGSFCIALIFALGYGFSTSFTWIIVAGTIGNLSDSFLGATLERKHILNNNSVNFLNTAIAASAALLLFYL
ncbi:MAG TPA: DUF92 domain-containing protein [Chitinophagaceae bacterium]|nr:DUF92 domain-containing protein [Chitinophagaceae bacterium]